MAVRIIAIIQARMSSSRLPGKVLLDISGEPMLMRVVRRTSRAAAVSETLVATTTDASDDPVADFCQSNGITYTRGSLQDVLDRYYQAAVQVRADAVVRITADCPVIDPVLLDSCVRTLQEGSYDFTCNRLPPPFTRTYPIGLDTEVCTFLALKRAWHEAVELHHREHVVPFLYEGVKLSSQNSNLATGISPRGFRIAQLHHEPDYGGMRWTVDTPADLEFMRQLYDRFEGSDEFSWRDVLLQVQKEPELAAINSTVRHKSLYDH